MAIRGGRRACLLLPRLPVLYRNPWRVIQGLWIWAASAPKPVEKLQWTFERAEAFAAALARDLERCAAIHAIMARKLATPYVLSGETVMIG